MWVGAPPATAVLRPEAAGPTDRGAFAKFTDRPGSGTVTGGSGALLMARGKCEGPN